MNMEITLNDIDRDIERLINEYGSDVLRISYLYLENKCLAEDAFQDTFLKVYKKWNGFKGDSCEKTWIIRIAINTCKDLRKSAWFRKVFLFDRSINNEVYIMEEEIINNITKGELYSLIKELPKNYKDIIILFYFQDYSIKDIAEILNMNEGTVKNRLSRGRRIMRGELERGERVNCEKERGV